MQPVAEGECTERAPRWACGQGHRRHGKDATAVGAGGLAQLVNLSEKPYVLGTFHLGNALMRRETVLLAISELQTSIRYMNEYAFVICRMQRK